MAQGWEPSGSLRGVFVKKKDGSLRIIFDTRILNLCFHDPPSTALPTAAAFANIEASTTDPVYFASADIRNAFYTLEIPVELGDMFTLPHIRAKHVNVNCTLDGRSDQMTCLNLVSESYRWVGLGLCICVSDLSVTKSNALLASRMLLSTGSVEKS